jgi:hypothetical protein
MARGRLISMRPICASGIVIRELCVILEPVGIESIMIWEKILTVVDGPGGNEKGGILGDEHSIVPVI